MNTAFGDNDESKAWRRAHPAGFIVNHEHRPTPAYLVLHAASCYTFNDDRDYTSSYSKTCSESVAELSGWARTVVGGDLQPCGHGQPSTG
jgi:hypothetical protein